MIKRKSIKKSETWTAEKPYLVYDYVHIDSTAVLTIEKGARVYFHNKASMYVNGTVKANGSLKEPIIFQGDRLEQAYKNLPDQWSGIVLFSGSHNNIFNHTTIKNANIGLQVGTLEHEGFADVELSNARIQNMSYSCLYALKSNITAHNTLISNCGGYAVALLSGGHYTFYHTTIANFWGGIFDKSRNTPSLVVKNYQKATIKGETAVYMGDLKATFANSIVYGTLQQEVYLDSREECKFNYLFDHCILKVGQSFINSDNIKSFENVYTGAKYNPLFKDPTEEYNFELDTLSPAKDIGALKYANMFQLDILGNSRVDDKAPDLGAFERIENAKK
ncbi:MAG: hypothetical protein CR987_01050 [Draconibacterium sp.]|nr:MAG: hypothetical protein CR987_01050 [Draconibacterium sp.]